MTQPKINRFDTRKVCEVMFLGCDESEENGIRSTNVIVRVMGKGDLSDESLQPDAFKVDFGSAYF
jgi:hypothetical protein